LGDLLLSWSPSGPFIDRVLEHIPPGKVRDGIAEARRMLTVTDPETVAYFLGNGRDVAARDTVPFTIWAAARHLAEAAGQSSLATPGIPASAGATWSRPHAPCWRHARMPRPRATLAELRRAHGRPDPPSEIIESGELRQNN